MTNNNTLREKLTALGKGNGFIVFAIDNVYVQFSVEEEDTDMYLEAASHNFIDTLSEALKSDFDKLGYTITEGNYYKYINRTSIAEMAAEVQYIFEQVYKVDYAIPFEITEHICG